MCCACVGCSSPCVAYRKQVPGHCERGATTGEEQIGCTCMILYVELLTLVVLIGSWSHASRIPVEAPAEYARLQRKRIACYLVLLVVTVMDRSCPICYEFPCRHQWTPQEESSVLCLRRIEALSEALTPDLLRNFVLRFCSGRMDSCF